MSRTSMDEYLIRIKKVFFIFLSLILFFQVANAQSSDTLNIQNKPLADSSEYSTTQNGPFGDHVRQFEIKTVKSERQPVWLFLILVFQLILVAYLRISFPKAMEDIVKAVMSLNIAQQLYRDQEQSMPLSAILYIVNFILSGGIFLFLLNQRLGWMQDNSIISMLFFLWAVIVIYSLRYGTLKLVSLIFPFGGVIDNFNFNFFLVQKILGLALILFNLLIAYAPDPIRIVSFILAIAMAVILGIATSIKGLTIARNIIARNAFHFFVYICTLEIAPICILVKVVVDG